VSTLSVRGLTKDYRLRSGLRTSVLRAVDDVSFTLAPGETVALVGQSGSGKSTIAKLLLRLERPTSGTIDFGGATVQMVFQDPFASLNPYHTVGHHLARPVRLHHRGLSAAEVRSRVFSLLSRVTLTPPEVFARRRPHELSGGQRQRVAIARALAPSPSFLVADEPVSMLDVSIRLGILQLLASLQRESSLGVLYITHDLATARHFSDSVLVLLRGRVVERGPADSVILNPQHPYTRKLADAAPDPERRLRQLGR
jgi:ABC-type glutathione transport system ATPase component